MKNADYLALAKLTDKRLLEELIKLLANPDYRETEATPLMMKIATGTVALTSFMKTMVHGHFMVQPRSAWTLETKNGGQKKCD